MFSLGTTRWTIAGAEDATQPGIGKLSYEKNHVPVACIEQQLMKLYHTGCKDSCCCIFL